MSVQVSRNVGCVVYNMRIQRTRKDGKYGQHIYKWIYKPRISARPRRSRTRGMLPLPHILRYLNGHRVSQGTNRERCSYRGMDYLVRIRSDRHFLLVLAVFFVQFLSFQVSFRILMLRTWAMDGVGNHDESWYSRLLAISAPPMNEPPGVKSGNQVSNGNIYLYRGNVRREA